MSTRDWLLKTPGSRVFKPNSYEELQEFIQTHDGPFSLAGGQYSSGGQTLVDQGTIISLSRLVSQVKIIPQDNNYWVSGGASWKYVLSRLVPHGLVPWSMQSYYNFTVGGAISVNAHGRNGRRVSDGLLKLLVMTMDGQIYECEPGSDLFESVVGGYGLIGIILEAQFKADYNRMIQCSVIVTPNVNPAQEITTELSSNPVLYNSELSPSGLVHLSWHEIPSSSCMNHTRCRTNTRCKQEYPLMQRSTALSQAMTRIGEATLYVIPGTNSIYHNYNWNNLQMSRRYLSYEMGYDAQNLVPMFNWRLIQSLLQEYFIPQIRLKTFLDLFQTHLRNYPCIELLNLSIRSLETRPSGYLDWLPLPSPSCSLHESSKCSLHEHSDSNSCKCNVAVVIYFGLKDLSSLGWSRFKTFTRHLVKTCLQLNGRWYLPYCPEFDREDLLVGYPRINKWVQIKQKYDPQNKLRSKFGEYLFKLLD